ncbi:hypothetical protein HispidOSU_009366, partial [Sigmodon hispidus]
IGTHQKLRHLGSPDSDIASALGTYCHSEHDPRVSSDIQQRTHHTAQKTR